MIMNSHLDQGDAVKQPLRFSCPTCMHLYNRWVYLPMIVRQENHINARQLVKIHGRIRLTRRRHARTEMDMVAGMEEVGLDIPCSVRIDSRRTG